ncbi:MAG: hypothetical protein DRP79_09860, partial [Planctomycetota bacterium]
KAEIFAPLYQDMAYRTFIGVTGIVLIVVLTTLIARSITKPISALGKTAKKVADGDLQARVPISASGEAGLVIQTFNHMIQRIQNWHEEFEEKLQERTARLNSAIETLEKEIAERKRIEKDLQLTQFAVDHLSDAAFWIGADARFLYVNEAACKSLGYSREELLKMNVYDIDPRLSPGVWPQKWRDLKKRKSITIESLHRAKDGRTFPVEINANFVVFEDKEYNCAFARDITERKRAEQALKKSEETLRGILKAAPIGIGLLQNRTFLWVNPQMCELTGYPEEELLGSSARILYETEEEYQRVGEIKYAQIRNSGMGSIDTRWVCKNGSIKEVHLHSAAVDPQDLSAGVIFTALDITERKRNSDKIMHLNLILRSIRNVNQIITKEKDQEKLIEQICKSFVDTRGYYEAWILLVDGAGEVLSFAEASREKPSLTLADLLEKMKMPACLQEALAQPEMLCIQEHYSICSGCPLQKEHSPKGMLVQRLEYSGTLYGIIKVAMPIDLVTDKEEQELFQEAAQDIAFALHKLELEKERDLAEEALLEKHAKLELSLKHEHLLATIASRINSAPFFQDIMDDLLKTICETTKVDKAGFYRFDVNYETAIRSSFWSLDFDSRRGGFPELISSSDLHVSYQRLKTNKKVILSNIPDLEIEEKDFFKKLNIKAVLINPLVTHNLVRGFLCFGYHEEHVWTTEEIELYETITDMIANAWEKDLHFQARLEAEKTRGEALQLVEKASRLASIGVMAAGITHEINQPLSAIKITADSVILWEEENKGVLPEIISERVKKISDYVQRINEIIRQMRSFAESSGKVILERIDLNDAVKNTLSLLNRQVHSHGISLETDLEKAPLFVNGNRIHLEQILTNLVVNAIQALD